MMKNKDIQYCKEMITHLTSAMNGTYVSSLDRKQCMEKIARYKSKLKELQSEKQ